MKTAKIFYMGERLKDVYPHATRWQVIKFKVRRAVRWFMRMCLIATIVCTSLFGAYLYGQFQEGRTLSAVNVASAAIMIKPEQKKGMPPVLQRIAQAESGGKHFSKTGQVLLHANVSGTYAGSVDIGKYGINNAAWGAQATKLGLDLMNEQDNEKMALWIYENYGTEPWYSSKANWGK